MDSLLVSEPDTKVKNKENKLKAHNVLYTFLPNSTDHVVHVKWQRVLTLHDVVPLPVVVLPHAPQALAWRVHLSQLCISHLRLYLFKAVAEILFPLLWLTCLSISKHWQNHEEINNYATLDNFPTLDPKNMKIIFQF